MRAETRHQLKQDRFSKVTLEAAENAAHWSEEHKYKLFFAAIVVIIIAAVALGGWYYIDLQDEKASADLSTAVRTLDTPVRPAGMPAQPDFVTFASFEERAAAARKQFQAIADKYPHTRTAAMARYLVGVTAAQLGDNATAENNLRQAASASNAELAALGKLALASVYRGENKGTQAVDLYKRLIDKPTLTVTKATAQLELAGYYESQQKPDEAKKLYDQVAKDNPSSEAAQFAQKRIAELK